MKTQSIPNYRLIKATFVPMTDKSGERVKLFESPRYSNDRAESKVFSYDADIDNVADQAVAILERNGMKIMCRCTETGYYGFLCDSWGEEFKSVRELK